MFSYSKKRSSSRSPWAEATPCRRRRRRRLRYCGLRLLRGGGLSRRRSTSSKLRRPLRRRRGRICQGTSSRGRLMGTWGASRSSDFQSGHTFTYDRYDGGEPASFQEKAFIFLLSNQLLNPLTLVFPLSRLLLKWSQSVKASGERER